MTNKRYWYDFEDPNGHKIIDTVIGKEYSLETVGDFDVVTDLLNKQHEENKQLKSELRESKKAHSNCDKLWWELHDEKEQLEKENEQLKQQLKELQEFKDNYDKNMELIHNSEYVQDFLHGNL